MTDVERVHRPRRFAGIIPMIVTILVLGVVGPAVVYGSIQLQRRASCEASNGQDSRQARTEKQEIRALIDALVAGRHNATVDARVATFLEKYDGLVADDHRPRKCPGVFG